MCTNNMIISNNQSKVLMQFDFYVTQAKPLLSCLHAIFLTLKKKGTKAVIDMFLKK